MRLPTHFDDRLRERADSEEALRQAIDEQRRDLEAIRARLADAPEQLERSRLGRTLNRLSEYLQLAGECGEACELCDEASAVWRDLGRDRAVFLARLRRADVAVAAGDLDDALDEADALVDAAGDEPFAIYRDFALELRGRVRANLGEVDAAIEDLERARERRADEGRDRLVERTERLLALIREER